MTDILTEEDLLPVERLKLERFKQWRQDKASNELPLALAAINLNRYINGKNLTELQKAFEDEKSPKYIELFDVKKPVFKLMLFARLSVEDYFVSIIDNENNEEGKLIKEIINAIGGFYDDYSSNIEARITNFLTLVSKWEENCPNSQEAEKLCLVFYTLLKIISIRINNMPYIIDLFVSYLIDLENCRNNIQKLLEKTTTKLLSLASPNSLSNQQIVAPIYQAVHDYLTLENRFVIKDEKNQLNISIIDSNLNKLITIYNTTTEILRHRKDITAYETEETEINAMLSDCNKYSFLDLIEKHVNIWAKLFNMANSTEQGDWKGKIIDINKQGAIKSFLSGTLSYLSFGTLPTTEENNKLALKKMSEERLQSLQPHLSIVKNRLGKLTTGNEDLNQKIQNTNSAALEKLVGDCDSVIQAIKQYRELAIKIMAQKEALEKIRGAHQSIDAFLDTYYDFFVLLSNFFARIWSIFKTEKAIIVDKVLKLKEESLAFEKGYEETLKNNISTFQNDPSLPLMAKEILIKSGLFEDVLQPVAPAQKLKKMEDSKLQDFFFSIETNHAEINKQVSIDSNDPAIFRV